MGLRSRHSGCGLRAKLRLKDLVWVYGLGLRFRVNAAELRVTVCISDSGLRIWGFESMVDGEGSYVSGLRATKGPFFRLKHRHPAETKMTVAMT